MKKESIIEIKSFEFALQIIEIYKLFSKKNEYILSKQLLRSGTGIGANVNEAKSAISKKDFINKMAIAAKEARETKYWIELLDKSQLVKYDYSNLSSDCEELIRILTSIIKTSQVNS